MALHAVKSKSRLPDLSRVPAVDEVGVNERVARFQSRSIKTASKDEALRLVLSMIDLTTLEGQDTPGKVRQLCQKAIHLHDAMPGLPHVAAVCVYPTMVAVAKQALEGHDIKVASVATAFPSGMSPLEVKLDDTRMAVEAGADEIDMVISRGAFLAGDYRYVFDEIAAVKEACGEAHLKVILETGELGTLDRVRRASVLAMHAGADFIKTSTGKIQPAATMPVTLVMLQAIRDYFADTGRMVGHEAGRRHLDGQARGALPGHVARDAGQCVDDARVVPLRREFAGQRRADAAREAGDRRLSVGRLFFQGLTMDKQSTPENKLAFDGGWEYVAGAGEHRSRTRSRSATACSSMAISCAPEEGRYFDTINPATEEKLSRVGDASAADVDKAVKAARKAYARRLVEDEAGRARQVHFPHRAHDPGARARVCRDRIAGRRQADSRVARRRCPAGGGALLLLRRLGGQARLRVSRAATPRRWASRDRSFRGIFRC